MERAFENCVQCSKVAGKSLGLEFRENASIVLIISVSAELLREVPKMHSLIPALVWHPKQQQTLFVGLELCLHHDNFMLLLFSGCPQSFSAAFYQEIYDKVNRDFSLPQTDYKTFHHVQNL